MPEIVGKIIQKIAEAPVEETLSGIVAGLLENTATKLSRFETTLQETVEEPGLAT